MTTANFQPPYTDLQPAPIFFAGDTSQIQASVETEKARAEASIATFEPIALADIARSALLDRFEVKYIFHINRLAEILDELNETYSVLVVEDHRLNRYRTLYFDTGDFALYRRHHMGARNRYKIRAREYVETGATFLEVKRETNKRRTIKNRFLTPNLISAFKDDSTQSVTQFVHDKSPYDVKELSPRLWNRFTRITLVSKQSRERVTLDLNLDFESHDAQMGMPGLVIAEVKKQDRSSPSAFTALMHAHHIRKAKFSKYCVGVSLLYPEIKHNKFKATHRLVARLMHRENNQESNRENNKKR